MRSRLRAAANAVLRRLKVAPNGEAFIVSLSPAAWYRNGVGITSSSNLVSAWADQSGNGRDLLQATGSNQPTLQAGNSILFDGVDDFLRASFTINQPSTVYAVYMPVAVTNNARIIGGRVANTSFLRWNASNQVAVDGGSTSIGAIATTVGSWYADCAVTNGASSFHTRTTGAGTAGNAGALNASGITLAANHLASPGQFTNTSFREVIVFTEAHDEETRTRVLTYLMSQT